MPSTANNTIGKSGKSYFDRNYIKRSPAWRYELAFESVMEGKTLRHGSFDPMTKRLRTYLLRKNKITRKLGTNTHALRELARRYGPLWNAENIFEAGEDDRTRYSIEAMILAGISDEEIARQFDVDTATITIYEACFFNVRERLHARRYIASTVIEPAFTSGLGNRTPQLVCKYFGYFGGPHILSIVMDGCESNPNPPQETYQVSRWLDEQFRLRFRTVAVIGATFMEPTAFTLRTLLEGFNQLLSLAHRENAEVGDDNVLSQALEMFAHNHSAPLGDDATEVSTLPVKAYADGVAEPRVAELHLLAEGKTPPALGELNSSEFVDPFKRDITSVEHDSANAAGNEPAGDEGS